MYKLLPPCHLQHRHISIVNLKLCVTDTLVIMLTDLVISIMKGLPIIPELVKGVLLSWKLFLVVSHLLENERDIFGWNIHCSNQDK